MWWLYALGAAVTAGGAGAYVGFVRRTATQKQASLAARAVVERAKAEAQLAKLEAEAKALEQANIARAASSAADRDQEALLDRREATLSERRLQVELLEADVAAFNERIEQTNSQTQSQRDRAAGVERDATARLAQIQTELEARAGVQARALMDEMRGKWLRDAQARGEALVRAAENLADPAHDRQAQRILEISSNRYQNHFLTERNISNLRVGSDIVGMLLADDGKLHAAIERAANVRLLVNDEKDAVRLDGQDGVGREVARRAVGKLVKKPEAFDEARPDPDAWAMNFRDVLTQEIRGLGRKAFQVLGVPKSHPEIVDLVGALNYRTSYTQNQWLHAVEASFLAGMMAAELGLDEKLARKATLLHDIGKALTHQIEGSHAVIGADIARRLGEDEVIANAIGSHHADEPANSAYAYLTAASDAMSGARPGARREQTEGFSTKIEDLERIARRRGVARAHAVHGGRELRVYVREQEVNDAAVIELSSDIAAQIADELTFPGQIKVTVIRSFEAVATAS